MCPQAFLKAKADGNMMRYKMSTYMKEIENKCMH